jgi:hypothetical protein
MKLKFGLTNIVLGLTVLSAIWLSVNGASQKAKTQETASIASVSKSNSKEPSTDLKSVTENISEKKTEKKN